MSKRDAIVVGSGPNGLAAAIALARAGLQVEVREAAAVPGGAARSAELTLPGFVHDLGSAVHPMALSSPFFSQLDLQSHGLEWRWSPAEVAHPLDDGTAVLLFRNVAETAAQFGRDARAYRWLFEPLQRDWPLLTQELLKPLWHFPRHPLALLRLGIRAALPAALLPRLLFREPRARALFAGLAAHSVLPFRAPLSSAFGLMLGAAAHAEGWPIPVGGAQSISTALLNVLSEYGGTLQVNAPVERIEELEPAALKLFDVTPKQLLRIAGDRLPAAFQNALNRFRYGPGVFKLDWSLSQPIPWRAQACLQAITVHVGGSLEEIEQSERDAWAGRPPSKPFVLLAQPSLFDATRAPSGRHTAWAYCHVPNGWTGSAQEQIESQIERFAPGFRDCILARAVHSAPALQAWNANLVGGDIGGGAATLRQFLFRPTWRQYATPLKDVFLCSSSTSPGGGVHGMCGYNAANWALRQLK